MKKLIQKMIFTFPNVKYAGNSQSATLMVVLKIDGNAKNIKLKIGTRNIKTKNLYLQKNKLLQNLLLVVMFFYG